MARRPTSKGHEARLRERPLVGGRRGDPVVQRAPGSYALAELAEEEGVIEFAVVEEYVCVGVGGHGE